jgi:hypothetical protein
MNENTNPQDEPMMKTNTPTKMNTEEPKMKMNTEEPKATHTLSELKKKIHKRLELLALARKTRKQQQNALQAMTTKLRKANTASHTPSDLNAAPVSYTHLTLPTT